MKRSSAARRSERKPQKQWHEGNEQIMKTEKELRAALLGKIRQDRDTVLSNGRLHTLVAEKLGISELTGDEKQIVDELWKRAIHEAEKYLA